MEVLCRICDQFIIFAEVKPASKAKRKQMETDKKPRITQEKRTVEIMIRLYCRKKEKNATLCPECEELLRYAHARLDHCPFGEKKSSCKKCPVHCYKPAMRERMREVMRFSGPRMLFYAPLEAIRHLFS